MFPKQPNESTPLHSPRPVTAVAPQQTATVSTGLEGSTTNGTAVTMESKAVQVRWIRCYCGLERINMQYHVMFNAAR